MTRCRGETVSGKPCRSPKSLVDPVTELCSAHADPERMAEIGKLGAAATQRKYRAKGLDAGELGPLESHEDGQRWLKIAGEAVATGRISDKQATALARIVGEWVKAATGRLREVELVELQDQIRELKEKRDLKVVR